MCEIIYTGTQFFLIIKFRYIFHEKIISKNIKIPILTLNIYNIYYYYYYLSKTIVLVSKINSNIFFNRIKSET